MSHRTVLFLCTGNYYRSRFAEQLFNHLAEQRGVGWRAQSRGLSDKKGPGPISHFTVAALRERRVPVREPHRDPTRCVERNLTEADLVIAMKESEHRPMMMEQFGEWAERIQYWQVHDIDFATPDLAIAELDQLVRELVGRLAE